MYKCVIDNGHRRINYRLLLFAADVWCCSYRPFLYLVIPTLIDHYAGGGCEAQDGVKLAQDSCFRGAIGSREDIGGGGFGADSWPISASSLAFVFDLMWKESIRRGTGRFRRTRKPGVLAPLLPLSFIGGYQADMAYGNKLHRIRGEAENIMQFEMDLLELPCGLPSASSIDQARLDNDEKKKLHPAVPPI
uniref:Uncharacterized protein n=1 Tax=Timema douglasi TaxID=61478 RepID=A0A7R8VKK9_TIMDO|nr:unnamed protein product [Timema douglasi]